MTEKLLLVIRKAPYGWVNAFEAISFATGATCYDMSLTLLFIDEGVYCLIRDQTPPAIGYQTLEKPLIMMQEEFDIKYFAVEESLEERGLTKDDLNPNYAIKIIKKTDVTKLIIENEATIAF